MAVAPLTENFMSDIAATPVVEMFSWDPWGILDMLIGFAIGLYKPLMA